MRVWGLRPQSLARAAGVTVQSLLAFLRDEPAAAQLADPWIETVVSAFRTHVRQKAQDYLAAWDPDGFGVWQAAQKAAVARQEAELQARAAAAGAAGFTL